MNNVESISGNKPTSLRRQAASRANGAKSKGPVTPEGKARSSRNALTHGCLASWVTFNEEDERALNEIYDAYVRRFEPRDQPEHDLLEQVIYWNFRMRQTWMQITSTLGIQMTRDKEKVEREWHCPSDSDRAALAFAESIHDSRVLPLLERYSRGFAAQAERAMKQLIELRKQRLPPAPLEERNEPSSEIEHPAAAPGTPISDAPQPAVVAYSPARLRPRWIRILNVAPKVMVAGRSEPLADPWPPAPAGH